MDIENGLLRIQIEIENKSRDSTDIPYDDHIY